MRVAFIYKLPVHFQLEADVSLIGKSHGEPCEIVLNHAE